ncbi:heavy metal translocating P-type ATPase [Magnetospirillum molischianum]|uniref:P-type Zn(2+) transporter n=1 Tax=Magnetospirillum molischianum DSM 120 TaxID=1150626 RepID=H8FSQ9_MAGML|nr:heavy metal translocating P-type ATPase [Magnetospirillum molischianum]CCG41397.1 Lead, cadmium, zinc and mercury-transporting ATPase [Magnetospirillum molischianum DSM 120]
MNIMPKTRFRIEGVDCASCATKIDTAARRIPGVTDVLISVSTQTLSVTHAPDTDLEALVRKIGGLGYRATPLDATAHPVIATGGHTHGPSCAGHHHDHTHEHGHEHEHGPSVPSWWWSPKALLTIASGASLLTAYAVGLARPQFEFWAFLLAIAVGIVPIARRAVMAVLAGTLFSIELLMTIAAAGAIAIGATEEAAAVVFLFLVGELLEGVAAQRARSGIQGLAALVPKTARLETNDTIENVAAESLTVGAIVVIRPGDRIPADGQITDGESAIDESPVTGESMAKSKRPGDTVFAGTVNGDGVLRVRVTAAAADNTIARVVKLVEEAQESKAPTERFIDRFSRWYTPGVVAVAALVAVVPPLAWGMDWSAWTYKGLAILLIGCPCALVISTPAAIAAGLSAGARRGLLMKGGAVLETVGRITAIAFDKTGTLTEGKPKITDVTGFGSETAGTVLSLAAALETGSSHPFALAILAEAHTKAMAIPACTDSAAIPGKGVKGVIGTDEVFLGSASAATALSPIGTADTARIAALNAAGKSVSVVIRNGTAVGLIAMRDEPRADARRGLDALKAAGVTPVMLTGDNRATAEAVAALLGIPPRAELLPHDKQDIIREMQSRGEIVAKVGDGINDAPALAAADVGIAMGGGTDVALETADAAILHGRVMDIADMVGLSRTVMSNIRQNITIALGLKAAFLVTTIVGLTGLWPAILADTGATVLVTANAMRLLRWKGSAV